MCCSLALQKLEHFYSFLSLFLRYAFFFMMNTVRLQLIIHCNSNTPWIIDVEEWEEREKLNKGRIEFRVGIGSRIGCSAWLTASCKIFLRIESFRDMNSAFFLHYVDPFAPLLTKKRIGKIINWTWCSNNLFHLWTNHFIQRYEKMKTSRLSCLAN